VNPRAERFVRAVAEVVVLLDAGAIPRSSDARVQDLLTLVGTDQGLPDHLVSIVAAVVAELMLRPSDGATPAAPATQRMH
jgi:acid phosphatase family membrane protein YuiD